MECGNNGCGEGFRIISLDIVDNNGYSVDIKGYSERVLMDMYNLHVRPVRELRNNFSEISKLNKQHDAVVLTNRGRGTHVLLSFDEFNDYEEYRHNRYLMQKIKEAEDDPDTRLRSHDEVWRSLVKKYGV